MAVWEAANDLRKAFNWFAAPTCLALATLYVFIVEPLIYEPPLVLGVIPDLLAMIMGKPLMLRDIIDLIIVAAGVAIYFAVCFVPIKNNELNIWPVDIMTIISTGMICAVGEWTGVLMVIQWVFVWFLGDDPIWELAKSKST